MKTSKSVERKQRDIHKPPIAIPNNVGGPVKYYRRSLDIIHYLTDTTGPYK